MERQIITKLTLNNSYTTHNKSRNRKISSRTESARPKYPYLSKIETIKKPYKIIYTMPNNQKITKNMGKTIEKEELYENVIKMKLLINNLKKELNDCKSTIVKKNLEIKKKNQIIEKCLKDNYINDIHQENLEKGKESLLLSSTKEKYFEMNNNYKKKCKENEILKSNIKITKIKEFDIENDILKNEIEKYKSLYLYSQQEIQKYNYEKESLLEYKNKFVEQHKLINSLMKKNDELNSMNKKLIMQISEKNENLEKNNKEKKLLKVANKKLQLLGEQYFNEKKGKEFQIMNQVDNDKAMNSIQKELNEYKRLYDQSNKEIQILKMNGINNNNNNTNSYLKKIDINSYKNIIENPNEENEKIMLLKNFLKDYKIKIIIYEQFLLKNNYSLKKILQEGNYQNGLINHNSPNINEKSNSQGLKTLSDLNNNKENIFQSNFYESISVYKDINTKVVDFSKNVYKNKSKYYNKNIINGNNNSIGNSNNFSNSGTIFNNEINENVKNEFNSIKTNKNFNSIPEIEESNVSKSHDKKYSNLNNKKILNEEIEKKNNNKFNDYLESKTKLNDNEIILIKLKQSIKEKIQNFNDILKNNITEIKLVNKKIKAIKQQTFFNILKQFNIVITDEEQNQFFERFKIEDINDISEELMNFEEIINWYEL